MTVEIDVRGLSCPEPVVLVRRALLEADETEEIKVLLSTVVAQDNVRRLATTLGWQSEVEKTSAGFIVSLKKV